MEKIYSKIDPDKLLHIINRNTDMTDGRRDLSDPKEFLQICTLNLNEGKTFYPHKHIWKNVDTKAIAQESWIIIRGRVRCILYDIDDTIIAKPILEAGDCSITFFGGHNYEILDNETLIYEVKTGPYFGVDLDKIKIDESEINDSNITEVLKQKLDKTFITNE